MGPCADSWLSPTRLRRTKIKICRKLRRLIKRVWRKSLNLVRPLLTEMLPLRNRSTKLIHLKLRWRSYRESETLLQISMRA